MPFKEIIEEKNVYPLSFIITHFFTISNLYFLGILEDSSYQSDQSKDSFILKDFLYYFYNTCLLASQISLCLFETIFISLSLLKDSFAECRILG